MVLPRVTTAAGNDGFTNKLLEPGSVVGSVSVGAVYDSAMGRNHGAMDVAIALLLPTKLSVFQTVHLS